jgi:hypothetical protein
MKKQSATLKIGTPEIRVGLDAARPNPSMMKVKTAAENQKTPKDKKRLVKMPKRMKKM